MDRGTPGGLGSQVLRLNGADFLRGQARFIDDVRLPGTAFLQILRSPRPRARIQAIDTSRALTQPGVLAVIDGAQVRAMTKPIPHFIDPAARGGNTRDMYALGSDMTHYVGEPIAAVVAETLRQAQSALNAIEVCYEPMPHVLDSQEALLPTAPLVYPEWGTNILFHKHYGVEGIDDDLRRAPFRISGELRIDRQSSSPIETRGYLAAWDSAGGQLDYYASCQNPHVLRWMLAEALSIPENRIRVRSTSVGGSFGLKMQGHPEEVLIALASLIVERPVKWIESRSECLMAGARDQMHRFEVAAEADGTVVALKHHILVNVGNLSAQPGWAMANMSAMTLPSGYAVQRVSIDLDVVVTNKPPVLATRGFGKESAHLVMERAMDLVAQTIGLDPAEVRRRNMIPVGAFPYRTATGLNIDSGNYQGLLDLALAQVDYASVRSEQRSRNSDESSPPDRLLGIGIGFEVTPESADSPGTLVAGFDTATVRMSLSGSVEVLSGVTSPGGGNETALAQIAAQEIGIPLDAVRVVQGDTSVCPFGFGNFSGRGVLTGGGATALAARDIRTKLSRVAAFLLDVDAGTIELSDGWARHEASGRQIEVGELARTLYTNAFSLPTDIEPILESTRAYRPGNIDHVPDERGRIQPYPTYSSCLHIAVVEVDPATGHVKIRKFVMVHDCGTIINPALVDGQCYGAAVMGIGAALMESSMFDSEGRSLSDRLKTYLMPRLPDVPQIELVHQVTPSPFTTYGNKGAGEAGVGGAAAAVINAVNDALHPLDISASHVPLTPQRVLGLLMNVQP